MKLSEPEAEYLLRAILAREQQRWQAILAPYLEALAEVEARKPPQPIQMPDGRVAAYIGPTAEDVAGAYRAPRWLEKMCDTLGDVRSDLDRYRRQAAE